MALFLMSGAAAAAHAQNLGWDGNTGVLGTPLAYTAPSPSKGLGLPVVGYHFLDGGDVLGDFYNASVTVGAFSRAEFGYTRSLHSTSGDSTLGPLWDNDGFNIFHGKVNIVPENLGGKAWVPAVSTGFVARTQVKNVVGTLLNPADPENRTNADFYAVATKTVTQTGIPLILSGGVRGTNAQIWGLGGNAPEWEALAFGVVGFALPLPNKGSVVLAVELAQQPKHPEGLEYANVPTTVTYAARITPPGAGKLNIDFGMAQIAGKVFGGVPGVPGTEIDLKARTRFGMQMSYGF
jgi:hypothetical protein